MTAGCAGGDGGPMPAASSRVSRVDAAQIFLAGSGHGAVPPDAFPTIAGLDFDAFPRRRPVPPAPAPGGRTIHVAAGATGGDGSEEHPFGSPVRAVRAAAPGDVVLVGDGTYAVTDRRCGCGLAMWTSGVTLAAEHPGSVTFLPRRDVAGGLDLRGDGIAVVGLRLRGFPDAVVLGTEDHPIRDVILQRLVLVHGGILMGLSRGPSSQTPLVDGLLIADTRILGGRRPIIGINCAQGPCEDVRVSGVRISLVPSGSGDSGMDAIGVESGDDVLVEATSVSGADGDGIDIKASRAAVVNCWVQDVGRNGVKLWRGGDVVNSVIVDTGADAAVVFALPAEYRILHSIVARHSPTVRAYAATVSYDDGGSGRVQIVNSIFFDNSGAVWISPDYGVDVRNSIFFGSLTGELLVWGDVVVEEGEGFGELEDAGGGSGDRELGPRFVDPGSDDFHLAAESPARASGTIDVEAYVGFDLAGIPRGDGPPNLGPYEDT